MLNRTLEALGLKGHRFSLAQRRGDSLNVACFDSAERAAEWLEAGGAVDSYICGNPMLPSATGKPSAEDVDRARVLLVDVDPNKDDADPTGTSQDRRDAAWALAQEIHARFEDVAHLVWSGRGGQVWIHHGPGVDRAALLEWIRDEYRDPLCAVDSTANPERLMRLPGSVNTRTGEEVVIIAPRIGSDVLTGADARELLDGWQPPRAIDVPEPDRSPPSRIDEARYLRREALEYWREDPMEIVTDRSRRDYLFLVALLRQDVPADAASRLLHALPGGKAADRRDDSYWESTYRAAARAVGEERDCEATLETLAARVEDDPEWCLSRNCLSALAHLRTRDYAGWATMRARLKPLTRSAGISIADVDKLVAERARAVAAGGGEAPPDHLAIFVRQSDGGKGAWKLKDEHGRGWSWVSAQDVRTACKAAGLDPDSATSLAQRNPWGVTLAPFRPRVVEGRTWNESNARYAVEPVEGEHPTWDQLYRVVGRGLTEHLASSTWAAANGIETGEAYLLAWAATMLQAPRTRRAYLFLFSEEQGTGKSLFFESFRYLIGTACLKANAALTADRFNGELQQAVLCYTEEVDLGESGRKAIYNRLKDWTLTDHMSLERKYAEVLSVPNVLSWGQAANSVTYCPVYEGDDRVTMFEVQPPDESERVPKDVLRQRLEAEAPAFLWTLLHHDTPTSAGRYVVPPITTAIKASQAKAARSDLEDWLEVTPEWITWEEMEVVDRYRDWLRQRDIEVRWWPPSRVKRELPQRGRDAAEVYRLLAGAEFSGLTAREIQKMVPDSAASRWSVRRFGRAISLISRLGDTAVPCLTRRVARGQNVYDSGAPF